MKEYRSNQPPTFYDVEDGLNLIFKAHLENGDGDPYSGGIIPIVGGNGPENWLTFNPATRTFIAEPTAEHIGEHRVRVALTTASPVVFSKIQHRPTAFPTTARPTPISPSRFSNSTLHPWWLAR